MAQNSRRLRNAAVLIVIALAALRAQAQLIPGYPHDVTAYDTREVALLPPFCKYTQDFRGKVAGGDDQVQAERWRATLGPTMHHLHHYCWGLMNANRALLLARTDLARNHFFGNAVREFDYVIERSPKDFVLLPEALARKGQALLRLGQSSAGLEAIERSIGLKPDYWLPYAFAGDHFKDAGDTLQARDWLSRGLAKAPDAPALKSRLAELDLGPAGRRNGDRPQGAPRAPETVGR